MRLDVTLVPVSCERIKQVISRELGLDAPWSGRIFVSLYPANSAEDRAGLTSTRFRDGWQYRLDLPDVVDRVTYVRAVVQALLQETANRSAREHSAEIPAWLTEGLSQHILLSNEREVILPPPRSQGSGFSLATRVVNARKENPLRIIHKELNAGRPLSFQELSWPGPDELEGTNAVLYRSSAYFFLSELLEFDDGRACIRAMVAQLAQNYNWQFAFLRAFRAHFQRPLDIEKWWTLHLEHFTGRELAQTWALEESRQKLEELMCSAVQVRAGTNELPLHVEVTLQTIVTNWAPRDQELTLQDKIKELGMLRLRLAPEVALLADQYQRVLGNYLQARDRSGVPFGKKAARRQAAEQAVRDLNELDARRAQLGAWQGRAPVQASSIR